MTKSPSKKAATLTQDDVQDAPDPGAAVDLEARNATRESSGRITRPSTAEIRHEVMRFSQNKSISDFELGIMVALEWTMGERKTLRRPGK